MGNGRFNVAVSFDERGGYVGKLFSPMFCRNSTRVLSARLAPGRTAPIRIGRFPGP
jgi:hypothetical protein